MKEFTKRDAIQEILKYEGGYVNNPYDRGGETNYGITRRVLYSNPVLPLWDKYHFTGNMKKMPVDLAIDIYGVLYWDKAGCNDIIEVSPALALQVFDTAVNMGVRTSVKFLQSILNSANRGGKDYRDIVEDGYYGRATKNALLSYIKRNGDFAINSIILAHIGKQAQRYMNLAEKKESQERFFNGWMNRLTTKTMKML